MSDSHEKTVETISVSGGATNTSHKNVSENHRQIKHFARKSANGHSKTSVLPRNKTATTHLVEMSKKFVEKVNKRKRDENSNEKIIESKSSRPSTGKSISNEVEITHVSDGKLTTKPINEPSSNDKKGSDGNVEVMEKSKEDSTARAISKKSKAFECSDVIEPVLSSGSNEATCNSPKLVDKEKNENKENAKEKEIVAVVTKVAQDYAKTGAQTEKIVVEQEQSGDAETATISQGKAYSAHVKYILCIHLSCLHESWLVIESQSLTIEF